MSFSIFFQKLKSQRTLANFLSSSLVAIPVSLITSFLSLRNIDPVLMGTWTAVAISQKYASFFGFGIVNGMNRELPYELGQGNTEKIKLIASTTLSYTLLQSVLFMSLGLVLLFSFEDRNYQYALTALVLKLIIAVYSQYLASTFRSNSDFDKLSKAQWLSSGFRIISSPLIILGFQGFLLYMVLFDLSNMIFLHWLRPIKVLPRLDKIILKSIFKVGFPIFIASYITGLIDTIPRLYILKEGGAHALGLFAPVLMMLGVFEKFSGALQSYAYPKYTFQYGQGVSLGDLFVKNMKLIGIVFLVLVIGVIPAFLFVEDLISLFPKYKESSLYVKYGLIIVPFIVYKQTGVLSVVVKKFNYLYYFQFTKLVTLVLTLLVSSYIFVDALLAVIVSLALTGFVLLVFGTYQSFNLKNKQT